jgi:hypothetical protein
MAETRLEAKNGNLQLLVFSQINVSRVSGRYVTTVNIDRILAK